MEGGASRYGAKLQMYWNKQPGHPTRDISPTYRLGGLLTNSSYDRTHLKAKVTCQELPRMLEKLYRCVVYIKVH